MGIDKPGPEPTEEPNYTLTLTPEELKAKEDAAEAAMYEQYADMIAMFEDRGPIIPEVKRECEPEVVELETLFKDFELIYNIKELMAIEVLGPNGSPIRELRKYANRRKTDLFKRMKKLKNETNVSEEKMAEFIAKYDIINMAVGAILGDAIMGLLDHSHREVTL